jgi:hypothetical protein
MINNIVNKFVKEFEMLSKGNNAQEVLNRAGVLLDLTTSFEVVEQKIIHSDKNMKKHIGNLTSWALMLLVDNEIVYTDEIGPFGCPTSDTLRTAVTTTTKSILIMIICFDDYEKDIDEARLIKLCQTNMKIKNIKKIGDD